MVKKILWFLYGLIYTPILFVGLPFIPANVWLFISKGLKYNIIIPEMIFIILIGGCVSFALIFPIILIIRKWNKNRAFAVGLITSFFVLALLLISVGYMVSCRQNIIPA